MKLSVSVTRFHISIGYLCESPPVHVGASDKHMFSINNPELAVHDAPRQAAKVHLPHLNP